MAQTTIFLSVGDDSGDLHAANLMRAIHSLDPDVRFSGLGMSRMAAAGLELLDTADVRGSAMGMHNVLRMLPLRRRRETCRRFFRERRPDLVVPVDYGGFNLYLARMATRAGIPVLYYILPQVWAHGRYRLKKIRKWVTKALVIYPFEPELYRRYGVEVEYVGHPLFDELEQAPPREERVEELRHMLGRNVVALFPGSRCQEVRSNLPIMLQAGARLQKRLPDLRFAAVFPENVSRMAGEILGRGGLDVALPDVRAVELARASTLCITKSGTILLEIGFQLRPMVIFYRLHEVLYFFGRGIVETPYVGLVNMLAGRAICPERVMWKDDPDWVEERALEFLEDSERYERCQQDLQAIMAGFARPGASERAARAALEVLGSA